MGAGGLPKAEDLLRNEATTKPSAGTVVASSETAGAITKTVLDNGLIVLHRRITTTPLVNIEMFSLGGVTAENASNNGVGQLAMATVPRGTATRSAEQIADFFDLTGGDLQTTCGNNTWYWQVTCTKDDFAKTMEVYADVVNHPAFDPAQVAEMKARVLAQIAGQDASWNGQAFRYFKQQFFGPKNSPYQFTPLGTSENVSKFGADDLKGWYQNTILKAPRVIAIFGDVDNTTAVAMASEYFSGGALPTPPNPEMPAVVAAAPEGKPTVVVDRVAVQKTEQELAGVVIGFESDSQIGEPSEAGLIVSQCLTGGYGYPTGYIFETLRGQGWSYEAASQNVPGQSRACRGILWCMRRAIRGM